MKTLYLECSMGAAGDMLTAALAQLLPDADAFAARFNALGLPGVRLNFEPCVRCGISGLHADVTVNGQREQSLDVSAQDVHAHVHDHAHPHDHTHDHAHDHAHAHAHPHAHDHVHEHAHDHGHDHGHDHAHEHAHTHSGMEQITHLLSHVPVKQKVLDDALAVYRLIAEAESAAHNQPIEQVHFHEVGTLDAVADVLAVCMLIDILAPERIVCSAIHVGSGQVRCAHGILPVPAPATAHILRGVPTYGGAIRGELCTPTGAALLKHFCTAFGPAPQMQVARIGYGMGQKEFEQANCVRAFLGHTQESAQAAALLSCNLDDMTGEALAYCMQQLLDAGALDVWTQDILMKKGRPAVMLNCLCAPDMRETFASLIFRHTTTLGIRESILPRYVLSRSTRSIVTPYGTAQVKTAQGYGVTRSKIEYDDLARIARAANVSLEQARQIVWECDSQNK